MKLSEVVDLSSKLQKIKIEELTNMVTNATVNLKNIEPFSYEHSSSFGTNVAEIIKDLTDFSEGISNSVDKINSLMTILDKKISEITKDWKTRDYYINGMIATNAVDIETDRTIRKTKIDDRTKHQVSTKAESYTSWQYPVLEIGPGDGMWTPHLVAGDPLYLIDVHEDYIKSTISKFNPQYQKKIRSYIVSQHCDSLDLSILPQGQFGFIFAWNVFDYFPYENIRIYLQQCYNLLKPGGAMMFSYNNCEISLAASYAEVGFKSWMPKWLLTEAIELYGFEIIQFTSTADKQHWVEIKKPGTLTSIRATQPLSAILPRTDIKNVDIVPERTYNKQQIDRLKQIAIQMNIG